MIPNTGTKDDVVLHYKFGYKKRMPIRVNINL